MPAYHSVEWCDYCTWLYVQLNPKAFISLLIQKSALLESDLAAPLRSSKGQLMTSSETLITGGFVCWETLLVFLILKSDLFQDPWTRNSSSALQTQRILWNNLFPSHTFELKSSGSRFGHRFKWSLMWRNTWAVPEGLLRDVGKRYSARVCKRKLFNQTI